jgi:hypothetical protein
MYAKRHLTCALFLGSGSVTDYCPEGEVLSTWHQGFSVDIQSLMLDEIPLIRCLHGFDYRNCIL